MIALLFRLPSCFIPVNAVAAQVAEQFSGSGTIGFIVLGIIVGPVIVLILASMFGTPRTFKMPALFIGVLVFLIVAIASSFALIDMLLGFIVPQ